MCGIFGGIVRSGIPDEYRVISATDSLSHRGPDSRGTWIGKQAFLGHRRLSIVDLSSRADQPIAVGSHRFVFNGEIYNYKELRRSLESEGICFSTSSDTEVVAVLLARNGKSALNLLEGMFAIAVWDDQNGTFELIRDRFGEKPLFYYISDQYFLFASDICAFHEFLKGKSLDIDQDSLSQYLKYMYVPAPSTIYKGVYMVEPGTSLRFDSTHWETMTERYYSIPQNKFEGSYEDAKEELRAMLCQSVRLRQLAADVPVATFLSGGVDSSIITSLASDNVQSLSAYTVGFPEDPNFDESKDASLFAGSLENVKHSVIQCTQRDLIGFTNDLLDGMLEPFADASLIPSAYLASKVEEKVVLSGDAADELFGGYGVYSSMKFSSQLPNFVKQLLLTIPRHRNPAGINNPNLRKLALFHEHLRLSPMDEYSSWRNYARAGDLESLGLNNKGSFKIEGDLSSISGIMRMDFAHNLPDDMLRKMDLASMHSGKEVRLPFLSRDIVQFALSLPDDFYIRKGERKAVLKHAFEDVLSQELIKRRKKGFLLPIRTWLKSGEFKNRLLDLSTSNSYFDRKGIMKIMDDHASGRRDGSVILWNILVFLSVMENTKRIGC